MHARQNASSRLSSSGASGAPVTVARAGPCSDSAAAPVGVGALVVTFSPFGAVAPSSNRRACRAIISSSSVRITHAETLLAPVVIRGPPAPFAAGSSSTPSQAASRQTRSRIAGAFSPTPAVKTTASSPPSAAASEPSSRPIRWT